MKELEFVKIKTIIDHLCNKNAEIDVIMSDYESTSPEGSYN